MPLTGASMRAHDDEVHPCLPGDPEDLLGRLANCHLHQYRHRHRKVLLGEFIKPGPRRLLQFANGLVAYVSRYPSHLLVGRW